MKVNVKPLFKAELPIHLRDLIPAHKSAQTRTNLQTCASNMQLQSHGKLFPSWKDFHAWSNWSRKTNGAYVFTQPSSTRCLLHVWRAWRCQLLGTGSNQVQQQMPSTIPTDCVFTCHWENVTQFEYLYALWWANRVLWLCVLDWKHAEQIQNAHLFIWRQKKVVQTLQFTFWQEENRNTFLRWNTQWAA